MKGMTFALLPGAGGSAWYWHLVVQMLDKVGHGAIAISLPASDKDAGLPEYTAAAVDAIRKRHSTPTILVAQSLGAFTAPLVCEQIPIAMLILVNAMIPKPGETPGEWWGNTGHAEAKRRRNRLDGRAADAPFDPLLEFFHDVPEKVVAEAMAQGEPLQSEAVFSTPCTISAWPAVPTRVLIGRDDRFFPAEFQRRVARERLGVAADEMPGGHLLALSQPSELTARLVGYAAAVAP